METLIDLSKFICILGIILILSMAIFCPIYEQNEKIDYIINTINIYHSNFCNECGQKIF